tara:strand:- start:1300 stop:1551 length:252 start_codon:yes stop_codon:yes gene_type:complete
MSTTRTFETNITIHRDDHGHFISANFRANGSDKAVSVTRTGDAFLIQTSFSEVYETRRYYDQAYGMAVSLLLRNLQVQGSIFA